MNKWIAIPVIAVLAIAVIGGGYSLWQQTNKLNEAEDEIVVLEDNVSTLEGNVATLEGDIATLEGDIVTLEGNVATLETKLADSEAEVSTLEGDLAAAQSQISSLQSDLAATESDLAATESDLAAALAQVSDLEDFKTEAVSAWASLNPKLELGNQVIKFHALGYLEPTGQELIAMFKSYDPLVEAIGDAELSRLWGKAWPTSSREKSEREQDLWLMFANYNSFLERLTSLIESDIDELQALLTD